MAEGELAAAQARVSRAERKALDRATALRDEAEQLLAAARSHGARIRAEAEAVGAATQAELDAARLARTVAERDVADAQAAATDELRASLRQARADTNTAREERDKARAEVAAAHEEAKSAYAERDRVKAAAVAQDDLAALVALVESVEAERDALAAELTELRGGPASVDDEVATGVGNGTGNSVTPPA